MSAEPIRWDIIDEYARDDPEKRRRIAWEHRLHILRGILWGYMLGSLAFASDHTSANHLIFLLAVTVATFVLVWHHQAVLKENAQDAGMTFSWLRAFNPWPLFDWFGVRIGWVAIYILVFIAGAYFI